MSLTRTHHGVRRFSSTKSAAKVEIGPCHIPCTKISSKCIGDLMIASEAVKLLQEDVRGNFVTLARQCFLACDIQRATSGLFLEVSAKRRKQSTVKRQPVYGKKLPLSGLSCREKTMKEHRHSGSVPTRHTSYVAPVAPGPATCRSPPVASVTTVPSARGSVTGTPRLKDAKPRGLTR